MSLNISEPAKICNITGFLSDINAGSTNSCGGAFSSQSVHAFKYNTTPLRASSWSFDASRVSSIYSNDTNTLNPDSVTCRFFIHY